MSVQLGTLLIQLVAMLVLFAITVGVAWLVVSLLRKRRPAMPQPNVPHAQPLPDIRHKTFIAASPERVFTTLTTGAGWDAWFTQGTTVDARPGGYIRLRWEDFGPDRVTLDDGGRVLEVEPNSRFVFLWQPGERPTTVAFTLTPQGEGTLVEVVESGYEMSPVNLEALVRCATGWGEALTLLKFYLEHGPTEKP